MSVKDLIIQEALQQGVPPELALSVAYQESQFSQDARGRAQEIGIFQLLPSTAEELGVNPYSLEDNIKGGILYLKQQFDRFGDWTTALVAYNAGPSRAAAGIIPDSTKDYIERILGKIPTFSATATASMPAGDPFGPLVTFVESGTSNILGWAVLAAIAGVLLLSRR